MTTGKESGRLPTRDEAFQLLVEYGCDESVVDHCRAVSALAVKMARRCGGDVKLVEIGGILHDLGRCRAHTLAHAVEGARIASEKKLPKSIVSIIERHIGAGITRGEAKRLGLPQKDYIPKTLEEKIVAHSDNLISGTNRTSIKEAVAYVARQGQLEAARRILKLHRDLSAKCGIDVDQI